MFNIPLIIHTGQNTPLSPVCYQSTWQDNWEGGGGGGAEIWAKSTERSSIYIS